MKQKAVLLISLLTVIFAAYWLIFGGNFEPIITFFGAVIALIMLILPEYQTNINKSALLNLVKSFWITDILGNLKSDYPFINVKLEYTTTFVESSLEPLSTFPSRTTKIIDGDIQSAYYESGGSLLILGEAGSGKSTLLIELANCFVKNCENNISNPIPIILSLSSWNKSIKSLDEWIINELNFHYSVPKKVGKAWLFNHELILLLDELDCLPEIERKTCIKSINKFHDSNKLIPLVVCCKFNAYLDMSIKLNFQRAARILPLNRDQISKFLQKQKAKDKFIGKVLDLGINELLTSPSMLLIVASSYKSLSYNLINQSSSIEQQRAYIFNQYIHSMIERKGKSNDALNLKTIHWLKWLSRTMTKRSISVFRINAVQPNWLDNTIQGIMYAILSRGLSAALFCFMIGFFISSLLGSIFAFIQNNDLAILIIWFQSLIFSFTVGLYLAFIGFFVGLIYSLINYKSILLKQILPIEKLAWSWPNIINEIKEKVKMIFLQVRNPGYLNDFPIIYYRLLINIANSLSRGLVGVVFQENSKPKNRFIVSIQNGLLASGVGFMYGLVVLTIFEISQFIAYIFTGHSLINLVSILLLPYFLIGAIYGGISFFQFGGMAFIEYLSLRLILITNGNIPKNYQELLNHACRLSMMQKAGGGYTFVHSLLLDHFSKMDNISSKNA